MHSSFLLTLLTSVHHASHYPIHSAWWPVGDVASIGAGGVPLPATRVAPRTSGGQEHGLLPPDMMISFMGRSAIYTSTPIAGAPEVPRHFTHFSLQKMSVSMMILWHENNLCILAICGEKPLVTSEFPSHTESNAKFWCFLCSNLKRLLKKPSSSLWSAMPWCSCDVTGIFFLYVFSNWIAHHNLNPFPTHPSGSHWPQVIIGLGNILVLSGNKLLSQQ